MCKTKQKTTKKNINCILYMDIRERDVLNTSCSWLKVVWGYQSGSRE